MTQEIINKAKYKLATLAITIVFLYMSFDYSLAVYVVFFLTAWYFAWLSKLRGESLMNHELKQPGKMTKLCLFYLAQFGFYLYLLRAYVGQRNFFHEIIVFELGSLLFYLLLNGLKFLVNYLEFITLSNLYARKTRLFLFTDMLIHGLKILFQVVCLVRFTLYYNYPVFWARDIFVSILVSVEYIRKYFHSLGLVAGIHR